MADRTAPGVRITLLENEKAANGIPLDLYGRIISFTYEDAEKKADKVSIQLDNHDLSLFDNHDLVGGAILEVSWGFLDKMSPPRRVVIKTLKGFTTLTGEGFATSALLNQKIKSRCFEKITRSNIASQIAREHGFTGSFVLIDKTSDVIDTVNQAAETDACFLKRIAAKEGYEFYIDDSGFHWHERNLDKPPVRVFHWRSGDENGDVLSINVESNLIKRVGKSVVKGRNPMAKSNIAESADNQNTDRTTLSDVIEVVDPETGKTSIQSRNTTVQVCPTAVGDSQKAGKMAKKSYKKAAELAVKLSMQVIGDPSLRAKSVVEVQGISDLLSGKYYVKDVKHSISASGYFCDLKLIRDGVGSRARPAGEKQKGKKNVHRQTDKKELVQFEVVNPETGKTRIEYRAG